MQIHPVLIDGQAKQTWGGWTGTQQSHRQNHQKTPSTHPQARRLYRQDVPTGKTSLQARRLQTHKSPWTAKDIPINKTFPQAGHPRAHKTRSTRSQIRHLHRQDGHKLNVLASKSGWVRWTPDARNTTNTKHLHRQNGGCPSTQSSIHPLFYLGSVIHHKLWGVLATWQKTSEIQLFIGNQSFPLCPGFKIIAKVHINIREETPTACVWWTMLSIRSNSSVYWEKKVCRFWKKKEKKAEKQCFNVSTSRLLFMN